MKSTLRHVQNALANLVSRGTVTAVNAEAKMQVLQGSMLASENKGGMEHFEPYGFTSNPLPGAECIPVFLEGDRSHGLVIVAADRRYRITGLPSGAIAVGTPGNSIIIHPDGSMNLAAEVINLTAEALNINADTITSTGAWTHTGDLIADDISLPHHQHTETGSLTSEPV